MFTFSDYTKDRPYKYDQFARVTAFEAAQSIAEAYFALPVDQRPETLWISPQGSGVTIVSLLKDVGIPVSESYGPLRITRSRLRVTASV